MLACQRACQFSAEENTSILGALSRLSESNDPKVRRRSLIAIGWIGGEKEIPLLNTHLLTDSDALCRSWSASSFLQMAEGSSLSAMHCSRR
ncbi:MAG: HEAT repeat domain-containing protein [Desulfovibrio sp.]|nr:HEAT repeat domain-containing protein [Desulfovibrio sp.]